jgi:cytochrome c biogenesis protein CcmG, thiol:disulfide interchange protein DsbE
MNKKTYFILGILLGCGIFGIMIYGLFFAASPGEIPSAQIGKKAHPFTITTFSGQQVVLEELKGKPVIVNFWASWCVSCRQEAHILEKAHQIYTPKGAVFIGIAINDTREASLAFIKRFGKTYLLAPDDKTGSISLDYGVTAVPETFLIDREGFIVKKVLGAVDRNTLEEFLQAHL